MAKPPRVYKTSAIVLRQRRLGDTDKIITLYSADYGKVDAVAKGVRRVKSRLAGNVEPLSHGSYMFAKGRNLDIITQAQSIETFQPLRDDLGRLSYAFYAAELLDRATEERAENVAVYRLLLDTLRRLATRDDIDVVLRYFEMSLLTQLGYRPELRRCVFRGEELKQDKTALWAPALGGVVCIECKPVEVVLTALSSEALAALQLLQEGSFSEVAQSQDRGELAVELERYLRDAIHYALDQDVRSAAFLDDVRKGPKTRPVSQTPGAGTR
ncbi:MAG: DNA repair protein RecO [Chloroflexi bacterium]|nr:DNA repair protein RecO [Chloroflexota bacterium]